jgi:hypothetical protein
VSDRTDQELTAAAEVIIERVAVLRPQHDYETNGLVWAVASYAVGLQDTIDEIRAERDQLRAAIVTDRTYNLAAMKTLETERNRLRERLEAERLHRIRAVDQEVYALDQMSRLRTVLENAIRHIEQEQFCGRGSEQLSDLYRILGDESIAPEPDPPLRTLGASPEATDG